ncbi:MAG: hypothetical protein FIA99_07695 [Ruminiclostridium sp.]|nr:hypothetical protein [Ruminiclostridium sp.]
MYYNPYDGIKNGEGEWLKSNFHTHAGTGKDTCGAYEIYDVVALYKEAGYQVLTISNHDYFSDVNVYQSKYDITLINGFEYSANLHMLCIGVNGLITGEHRDVIEKCIKQGGISVLCHPNWQYKEYWPCKTMMDLQKYTGIEIYNGVVFRLNGTGLATDTWDYLLSQGRLVWGFGNDDFHRWYDLARAWNVVWSLTRKHEDILCALKNGSFYTSTGLVLNEISFDDGAIEIYADAPDNYVKDFKYIFIGKDGKVLDEQYGEKGRYIVSGNEMYIRVQVISEHGAMLWTQPIYNNAFSSFNGVEE